MDGNRLKGQHLRTKRLRIAPFPEEEWAQLQAIWRDFFSSRYGVYDAPHDCSEEGIRAFLHAAAKSGRFYAVWQESRIVGCYGFAERSYGLEMSYCFREKERGYATEAGKALLSLLHGAEPGSVRAGTALMNWPSVGLLYALGFEQSGREKVSFYRDSHGPVYFDGGLFTWPRAETGRDKVLVSACLAGYRCRMDGQSKPDSRIVQLAASGRAVLVCPEEMGGMPTPRPASERCGARVVNCEGEDVTQAFLLGAERALKLCRHAGCTAAILKSKSPSCGKGAVYDGTFQRSLTEGNGLFAQLLIDQGIPVYTEKEAEL